MPAGSYARHSADRAAQLTPRRTEHRAGRQTPPPTRNARDAGRRTDRVPPIAAPLPHHHDAGVFHSSHGVGGLDANSFTYIPARSVVRHQQAAEGGSACWLCACPLRVGGWSGMPEVLRAGHCGTGPLTRFALCGPCAVGASLPCEASAAQVLNAGNDTFACRSRSLAFVSVIREYKLLAEVLALEMEEGGRGLACMEDSLAAAREQLAGCLSEALTAVSKLSERSILLEELRFLCPGHFSSQRRTSSARSPQQQTDHHAQPERSARSTRAGSASRRRRSRSEHRDESTEDDLSVGGDDSRGRARHDADRAEQSALERQLREAQRTIAQQRARIESLERAAGRLEGEHEGLRAAARHAHEGHRELLRAQQHAFRLLLDEHWDLYEHYNAKRGRLVLAEAADMLGVAFRQHTRAVAKAMDLERLRLLVLDERERVQRDHRRLIANGGSSAMVAGDGRPPLTAAATPPRAPSTPSKSPVVHAAQGSLFSPGKAP